MGEWREGEQAAAAVFQSRGGKEEEGENLPGLEKIIGFI